MISLMYLLQEQAPLYLQCIVVFDHAARVESLPNIVELRVAVRNETRKWQSLVKSWKRRINIETTGEHLQLPSCQKAMSDQEELILLTPLWSKVENEFTVRFQTGWCIFCGVSNDTLKYQSFTHPIKAFNLIFLRYFFPHLGQRMQRKGKHYKVCKQDHSCWGKYADVERQTMKKTAEK